MYLAYQGQGNLSTTGRHGKIKECEERMNTAGVVAHFLNVFKCVGFTLGQPLGM